MPLMTREKMLAACAAYEESLEERARHEPLAAELNQRIRAGIQRWQTAYGAAASRLVDDYDPGKHGWTRIGFELVKATGIQDLADVANMPMTEIVEIIEVAADMKTASKADLYAAMREVLQLPARGPKEDTRKADILQAAWELKATTKGTLKSADVITRRTFGQTAKYNNHKSVFSSLVDAGLLESKGGRRGGYWLTASGCIQAKPNARNG